MRLFLVRHARPMVSDGVCYGSTDLPVHAREQQQVLEKLLPALPRRVPIYSSPLQRCRTLASALAGPLDAGPVMPDARLAEMHFGAWELCAWDAISRAELDAWSADLVHYRPGGGESVLAMAQRVHAFRDDLRERGGDSAILICHAGTIRLLCAARAAGPAEETALRAASAPHRIGYGETIEMDC